MLRPGVDALASPSLSSPQSLAASSRAARGVFSGPVAPAGPVGSIGCSGTPGEASAAIIREGDVASAGGSRLLAARLLERNLLRLGRADSLVERRLAPALQRLTSRRLYRLLGYVRLGDYLTERLGMSLRRCQAILRLERVIESLPRLGQALRAGEVSVSKVEAVAGVATDVTEALWLDRARRMTVADLRESVRTLRAGADPAIGSITHAGDGVPPPSDSVPVVGAPVPAVSASVPAASPTVSAGEDSIEQDEPGRLVAFAAPAPVFAIWHWTLDLVRRVAGRQEPVWRCAEYLAAEFLSGGREIPDDPGRPAMPPAIADPSGYATQQTAPSAVTGRFASALDAASLTAAEAVAAGTSEAGGVPAAAGAPAAGEAPTAGAGAPPGGAKSHSDHPGTLRSGTATWEEACHAVREALSSIGGAADVEAILSETAEAAPDGEADAWELDALLRRLVRLRQSLAWRQGRLLAVLASANLHRDLGFDSLDDWIGDRLPMSPRRARYLISLDRRLRPLPLLADAYRRGLVSWCQVRLLVRVVVPGTQSRWIRYARQVTVRRLEDVVVACEVESAGSAIQLGAHEAPAHVGAGPLPPDDPLPGTVARAASPAPLHTSAPLHPSAPLPPPSSLSPSPSLHTSAPPHSPASFHSPVPLQTLAPPNSSAHFQPAPLHTSAPLSDREAAGAVTVNRCGWKRIAFWAPLDVATLWESALRACRSAHGSRLDDWECFLIFVQALRDTWENPDDPQWKRRYRIFERDGWRCMAPGCTSRNALNEHHIVFRSQQGGDDESNLVTLCIGHHQGGVHEGHLRCSGRAPDALWWDLGIRPGGEPLERYFGQRIVTRRSHCRDSPDSVSPDRPPQVRAPLIRSPEIRAPQIRAPQRAGVV